MGEGTKVERDAWLRCEDCGWHFALWSVVEGEPCSFCESQDLRVVEFRAEPDGPVLEVVNPGVCGWCNGPLVELCPDGDLVADLPREDVEQACAFIVEAVGS